FIFVAAAKYCIDVAIHQHGCCVLQRCISHSIGEHRENLVAEISANGLLLSQDAYGNYVIQFILELRIPSATSNLISQFEGNYVHLSKQKFGSHVVEKCLMVFNDECQSRLIHELLSVPQFERLLQDPHANYVVQTALRVSEGPIHNALVEAIESHKAISRNSPYSKRIFSQKLLKNQSLSSQDCIKYPPRAQQSKEDKEILLPDLAADTVQYNAEYVTALSHRGGYCACKVYSYVEGWLHMPDTH
ncbi:putative pumilio like protein 7, partial [Quercus suber]